jgi:hypothetical protein
MLGLKLEGERVVPIGKVVLVEKLVEEKEKAAWQE